jgi:hypothetical protein
MNRKRRMLLWTVLLTALLAGVALHTWGRFNRARRSASQARTDLAATEQLLERIEQIRNRPTLAADRQQIDAETIGRIEQAARDAGINPASLAHINPQRPQRIGDSVYQRKPTQVLLRGVTLGQTLKMMHGFCGIQGGLQPASIRLSAPRRDDTGPLWNAELTLTYMIYAPPESK